LDGRIQLRERQKLELDLLHMQLQLSDVGEQNGQRQAQGIKGKSRN
jgi:hypothetical protein